MRFEHLSAEMCERILRSHVVTAQEGSDQMATSQLVHRSVSAGQQSISGGAEPLMALSPEQVARTLGVSRTKVFQLMATHELKSIRIGKHRRVPVWEVEGFLRRGIEEAGV